jgi:hypothetical protein
MELQAHDEESMIKVAVSDLDDRFASIDRSRIEAVTGRLVHEWFARARVKTFVGIIAERHARAELRQVLVESELYGASTCGFPFVASR